MCDATCVECGSMWCQDCGSCGRIVCEECGERIDPVGATECPECGEPLPVIESDDEEGDSFWEAVEDGEFSLWDPFDLGEDQESW